MESGDVAPRCQAAPSILQEGRVCWAGQRAAGRDQAVLLVLLRGYCLGTFCLCCFPEQEQ